MSNRTKRWHTRIQATFQRFSETIEDHGGIAHELRGDALVAEFERASDAISAALSYQAANAEFNSTLDTAEPTFRLIIEGDRFPRTKTISVRRGFATEVRYDADIDQ